MRLSWKHVTLDHPWTWCHCLISHLSLPKQLQPVSIVSPRHRGPFSHSPQNLAAQWARTSMDPDHLTVVLPVAAGTCLKGVNLCIVLETADDVARWLEYCKLKTICWLGHVAGMRWRAHEGTTSTSSTEGLNNFNICGHIAIDKYTNIRIYIVIYSNIYIYNRYVVCVSSKESPWLHRSFPAAPRPRIWASWPLAQLAPTFAARLSCLEPLLALHRQCGMGGGLKQLIDREIER